MPKVVTKHGNYYNVQLDVDGIEERRRPDGARRFMLNEAERDEIQKMRMAEKVIHLLIEESIKIPEIAEQLGVSQMDLARQAMAEPEMRKGLIQQAVELFLDINVARSRKRIAQELGISIWQLKKLIESDEFANAYDQHFATLSSDPTLKVVNSKLVEELLPKSIRALESILDDKKAPPSVRLKAALETMRLAGVKAATPTASDRKELSEFLAKHNINVTQVNVTDKKDVEVIEGEISDV